MKLIQTITLTSAQSNIEFTSIPQTFTDLVVLISARTSNNATGYSNLPMRINDATTQYTTRHMYSPTGSTGADVNSASTHVGEIQVVGESALANAFGSARVYLPEYTGSKNKTIIVETGANVNATTNFSNWIGAGIGLRANTAAITKLTFAPISANLVAGSTISLYGILKGAL